MKRAALGSAARLSAVLACWAIFLILLRSANRHAGIGLYEETHAAAAYGWLHQAPGMMGVPRLRLFGWWIPVMYTRYIGPWAIYGMVPFVAAFGGSVAALRAYNAFFFLLSLLGTYRLALALYGDDAAALLAALLLAVCPTMVTVHTLQVGPTLGVTTAVWTLVFGASFLRGRKPADAWLAASALTAGLCAAPWMAGVAVGLLLCFALAPRRWLALLPRERGARLRLGAGCLACASFFLLPVLAFNVATGGETVRFYFHHLVQRAYNCSLNMGLSCDNLEYWRNLKLRLTQLASFVDGEQFIVVKSQPWWHYAYAVPLLLSLACAARQAWRRKSIWSGPALLWTVVIGYLLVSPISPTNEVAGTMTPLAPILAVLTFAGLGAVATTRLARRACLAAVAALAAAQFAGDTRMMTREGLDPAPWWYQDSPTLIDACRWAATQPRTPLASLSDAFSAAAPFFSENRARLAPLRPAKAEPMLTEYSFPSAGIDWRRWLLRKNKPLLVVENDSSDAEAFAAVKSEAAKLGLAVVPVKTFPDSDGHEAFGIYAVQR